MSRSFSQRYTVVPEKRLERRLGEFSIRRDCFRGVHENQTISSRRQRAQHPDPLRKKGCFGVSSCLVSSVQDRSAAQLLYEEEVQLYVVIEFAKDLMERYFLGVKRPSGCFGACTLIKGILESLT